MSNLANAAYELRYPADNDCKRSKFSFRRQYGTQAEPKISIGYPAAQGFLLLGFAQCRKRSGIQQMQGETANFYAKKHLDESDLRKHGDDTFSGCIIC